jgi:hypothetical protein
LQLLGLIVAAIFVCGLVLLFSDELVRRELALDSTAYEASFEVVWTFLVFISALTAYDLLNMMGNS